MKDKIKIDGTETTMHGYGIGYHTEGQNKMRIKHLWINTSPGRYVFSRIVNDDNIGKEKPTELTFTKTGRCFIRTMDAAEKEMVHLAYGVTAPRKRVPGKRGRQQSYTTKELNNVENSIRYHNGSIKAAAQALDKDLTEVRRMHDARRHRQRNLNTELRKRK